MIDDNITVGRKRHATIERGHPYIKHGPLSSSVPKTKVKVERS